MALELLACLCACSAICVLFKRGGGERRLRRILAFTALSSSALLLLWSLLLSTPSELDQLEQFVGINCSEYSEHGTVGVATRHQWFHALGYTLDDLRIHWAFPQHPNAEDTTASLRREFDQKAWKAVGGKYAHRIFGYLLPPITGVYFFQVSLSQMSARGSAEFWLSPTSSPSQAILLGYAAVTRKNVYSDNVISKGVFLQSCGIYYFEFLEQAYSGRSVAEVKWRIPGLWGYSSIPSSAIANVGEQRSEFISTRLPSISLQRNNRGSFVGDTVLAVQEVKVLPECQYKSKMGYAHDLKPYWGHKEVVWSHLFPLVDSGTKPVQRTFAANILRMYTEAFNKTKQRGVVQGIRYMDTTPNVRNRYLDHLDSHRPAGTRILLEMDIKLEGNNGVNHTSEYVYLPTGSHTLCHTSNFQWKRNVDVHIVVSVKNLGLWVQHLIHNMDYVYKVTKDEHFQLIIVDYGSEDLDIEAELRASSLPRWKVISLSGGFSRSGGLQAGIDYVTDPDSIVMTVDMHLTLPPGFVEYTRRHVVKGKMGFAPMFFRLSEGHTEMSRVGFWETLTYGLLGMYKSDWIATGGFDTQKYTTQWGGEDWDAVDKIRSHGLELFRIGYPGLVHYFHSKKGMWGHR